MAMPSDTTMISMFDAFHLPRHISIPVFVQVKMWVATLGPETTVNRLKDLKSFFLTRISNNVSSAPWIAVHSDGYPKGPFRPLFRLTGRKGRVKAINALMVYTGFVSQRLTDKQWKKFHESFTASNPFEGWSSEFLSIMPKLQSVADYWYRRTMHVWSESKYSDPYDWVSSPTKRATGYGATSFEGHPKAIVAYYNKSEMEIPFDDHLSILFSPLWYFESMEEKLIYEEAIGRSVEFISELYVCPEKHWLPVVGSISVIQERGMKARIIANPHRVHQIALSRLGNFLFRVLRYLPWDCTFDQQKGVDYVSEALKEGKTVHCYDLSDATNHLPLDLQMFVMSSFLHEEMNSFLRLFSRLARARWVGPGSKTMEFDSKYIVCTKGQPLGLYPSFPLFALTHGFVVRSIEREYGLKDTFRVLGDDIVITNSSVAKRYLEVMEALTVPISPSKSIVSDEIGEFAGKVIDKDGALPVEKWKGFSRRDPLTLLRWLGIPGAILLPRKLRRFLLQWGSLPGPVGLGLNPKGIPRNDRLTPDLDDLYLKAWYDPGRLQVDSRDKRERRRDAILAFKGLEHVFAPPISRTERYGKKSRLDDELTISHLNSIVNDLGWLPDRWKGWFESYLHQTTRQADPKQETAHATRFFHLIWKTLRRLGK